MAFSMLENISSTISCAAVRDQLREHAAARGGSVPSFEAEGRSVLRCRAGNYGNSPVFCRKPFLSVQLGRSQQAVNTACTTQREW